MASATVSAVTLTEDRNVLNRAVRSSGPLADGGWQSRRRAHPQGITGIGEASPVASTDADTQRSIIHVIADRLALVLHGRDPLDLPRLQAALERAVPGHHCAKAGIDIALHDVAGRALGVPVYQVLGGRFRDELSTLEADIWIDSSEAMAEAARAALATGVSAFEIKIGTDPAVDVERVRAVREAVGSAARLRVDCNEGYSAGTALKPLRAMERFDLD